LTVSDNTHKPQYDTILDYTLYSCVAGQINPAHGTEEKHFKN